MFEKIKNLFKKAKETAKKIGKAIVNIIISFFEDNVLTLSDGVAGIMVGMLSGMILIFPAALEYKIEAKTYSDLFGDINKLPSEDVARLLAQARSEA